MTKKETEEFVDVTFSVKPGGLVVLLVFILGSIALVLEIDALPILTLLSTGAIIHQVASVPKQIWLKFFFLSLWLKPPNPNEMIETLTDYANIARKNGILELEQYPSAFPPLQSAINNCMGGADPDFLMGVIKQEEQTECRGIRFLSCTIGFILVTIALWLIVVALLTSTSMSIAIRSYGTWLMFLALFGFWNHWRLGVLEHRLQTTYKLIRIGIGGIMVGVNPRMLQVHMQAGQDFYWNEVHESNNEEKDLEPAPTKEEVLADLDRYLENHPPIILNNPQDSSPENANEELETFQFSDLVQMDDRSTQTLLREISNDLLLTALKGATPRVAHQLMGNIGPRAGKMLVEELTLMGPAKEQDVWESQQEILQILYRLESEGSLLILHRDELWTFPGWESWGACRGYLIKEMSGKQVEALEKAFRFAEQWHGDQKRPSGEPYTMHLLQVLEILLIGEQVRNIDFLIAGLLHDAVEDTDCTLKGIEESFGSFIASLVDWLTKPERNEGESKEENKKRYLERLRQAPPQAITVKLADRLSNVQFLHTHPRPEFQKKYYQETIENILPLTEEFPWFQEWFERWQDEACKQWK